MNNIISSPIFGVLLSLIAFEIGVYANKRTKLAIFNPLLIAVVIIVFLLTELHIKYDDFNIGGQLISFFLYPATVALALPMYKKISLFKKNVSCILISILCGQASGIICIIFLSKLFNLSDVLTKSLMPKSITTPIGMAVSMQLNGIPSITVMAIILTGILGSIIGPFLLGIIKVKDKVAIGIAMGASSHAVGTAKALELGEVEGSMSGLAMAISGIITVFLAPAIWNIFLKVFK